MKVMKAMRKWMMSVLSALLIAGMLTFPGAGSGVFAGERANEMDLPPISVVVNGKALAFEGVPDPVNINGSVLVPMRVIFESMGAAVEWDPDELMVTGTLGDRTVRTSIGSISAFVNEERVDLNAPSQIIDGTTMVPVRVVAEGLDAKVEWDHDTQVVKITMEGMEVEPPEENEDENENDADPKIPADDSGVYRPIEEGGYFYSQNTLPSGGCLLACMAMVSSNIHQKAITPKDVYAYNGYGVYLASWTDMHDKLDLKRAETIDFLEVPVGKRLDMIAALLEVYPEGVVTGFKKGGKWHYIVVMGYDEETGTLYVNDPVGGHNVPLEKTWTGYSMFSSQEEAVQYLQNGKTFLHVDGEDRQFEFKIVPEESEGSGASSAEKAGSEDLESGMAALPEGI